MSVSTLRARLQLDAQAVTGPSSFPTPLEPLQLRKLLLAEPSSAAALPLTKAVWNARLPVTVHTAPCNALDRYTESLREGGCMPLGGPEYARRCMSLLGVPVPQMNCYPKVLLAYMLHMPRKVTASAALIAPRPVFVKPVVSGTFPAFVLRQNESEMSAQDMAALGQPDARFAARRACLGRLRAAAGQRVALLRHVRRGDRVLADRTDRSRHTRARCGRSQRHRHKVADRHLVAIDMGVLEDGTTTLLRVRDPWTLEYLPYGDERPKPLDFLAFVWERWAQVCAGSRFQAANSALIPIS